MTTIDRPTGTFKVLYDDADTVRQHIEFLVDSDPIELRDLALNLLDDLEEARKVIAVAYERLDQTAAAPSATYIVVKGEIVGNEQAGFEHVYGSDREQQSSREKAVSHGWEVYEHDDWLILKLDGGMAAVLSWMDEERDDAEELAEVARQLGLEVAR